MALAGPGGAAQARSGSDGVGVEGVGGRLRVHDPEGPPVALFEVQFAAVPVRQEPSVGAKQLRLLRKGTAPATLAPHTASSTPQLVTAGMDAGWRDLLLLSSSSSSLLLLLS